MRILSRIFYAYVYVPKKCRRAEDGVSCAQNPILSAAEQPAFSKAKEKHTNYIGKWENKVDNNNRIWYFLTNPE